MALTRKATIDDLLAVQACHQSENHRINYLFCHHILSWLQFPYVAEDYGGKIVGYNHITSISDLRKLGLATKFMAAAQNATEQAKKRHRVYFMACDVCQKAKIRPGVDYMDKMQEYDNPRMCAIVSDWVVEGPLEYVASYICELSFMEYGMMCYPPSVVAASAIFIARYLLFPSQKPWDSTLRRYTQYQPSDLYECVKALLTLVLQCENSTLPAIREKYSKEKMVPSLLKIVDSKQGFSNLNGDGAGKREKLYLVTASGEKNLNLDYDSMDPQSCEISPFDDYLSLIAIKEKKRIRFDYMDKVQGYAKSYKRASTVNWLVRVAASVDVSTDALYLAIYYMDLYLSSTLLDRNKFQLLGVACLLIASKYEDVHPAEVKDLHRKIKRIYSVDELLEMEVSVLNILEFELWVPTVGCFLERLLIVAEHVHKEASFERLVCLIEYIGELSLMDYGILCYAPSVVAASAVFLARYILSPSQKPWNSTFTRFTKYQPSDLYECVKALHTLVTRPPDPKLRVIRNIYSEPAYMRVAKQYCPPSIPMEHFENGI